MTPIGQPCMCEPMTWLYFVFVQSVFVFVGRPSRRLRSPPPPPTASHRRRWSAYPGGKVLINRSTYLETVLPFKPFCLSNSTCTATARWSSPAGAESSSGHPSRPAPLHMAGTDSEGEGGEGEGRGRYGYGGESTYKPFYLSSETVLPIK
jgi:hypothetical protein